MRIGIVGFGCTSCNGMSGPLPKDIEDEIVGRYFNPLNGVFVIEKAGDALQVKALDGWVFDASLTALGGGVYEGECRYLGMHALARKINRVRFVKDDEGVAIHTLGLGVLRKINAGV